MNDGRIHDVSQFLVVLTSNLGTSRPATKSLGFGADVNPDPAREVRQAVARHFAKETLGRIDDVVVFAHLSVAAARELWDREISSLGARLSAAGAQIEVQVAEEVAERFLGEAAGRIKAEGARAVRKLVDRVVADRCLELLGEGSDSGRILVLPAEGGAVRYRLEGQLA